MLWLWLGSSHPRWSAENREDSALPAHRAQGPRQDQWGSARQEGEEGRGLLLERAVLGI